MKQIFINLKRFDVPRSQGGVCSNENSKQWAENIIEVCVNKGLGKLKDLQVVFMFTESLILSAAEKLATYPTEETAAIQIGCQGVFREDIIPGGNFGAFTTNRPAVAAKNLGCTWTVIGHSEERKDKISIMAAYEPRIMEDATLAAKASAAVSGLINKEALCALKQGMSVLLCVGETAQERGEGSFEEQKPRIEEILEQQLVDSLAGVGDLTDTGKELLKSQVVIGYEPIWAIGPGKVPPGADYIAFVSATIKKIVSKLFNFDPVVVYGGGLKEENAAMIASIPTIGGGLVALTRFSGDIGFYPEELVKIIEKYV